MWMNYEPPWTNHIELLSFKLFVRFVPPEALTMTGVDSLQDHGRKR